MKQHIFLPSEDPLYPSSDGLPLAENDWQLEAIIDALCVLKVRYGNRPDVFGSPTGFIDPLPVRRMVI